MIAWLSLHSESSSFHGKRGVPRLTIPNPFNLRTDERGYEKERQLAAQLLQQKSEEEKATDYPVVPWPEGFQLESFVPHEMKQKLMEEIQRMESLRPYDLSGEGADGSH